MVSNLLIAEYHQWVLIYKSRFVPGRYCALKEYSSVLSFCCFELFFVASWFPKGEQTKDMVGNSGCGAAPVMRLITLCRPILLPFHAIPCYSSPCHTAPYHVIPYQNLAQNLHYCITLWPGFCVPALIMTLSTCLLTVWPVCMKNHDIWHQIFSQPHRFHRHRFPRTLQRGEAREKECRPIFVNV